MAWEQVKPAGVDERQEKAWDLMTDTFFLNAHHCEICEKYSKMMPILDEEGAAICVVCGSIYSLEYFIEQDKEHKPILIEEIAIRVSNSSEEDGEWVCSG